MPGAKKKISSNKPKKKPTKKKTPTVKPEVSKTEYTFYEAARELGVSISVIWDLVSIGELEITKTKNGLRIPEWSLREFIHRNKWDRS